MTDLNRQEREVLERIANIAMDTGRGAQNACEAIHALARAALAAREEPQQEKSRERVIRAIADTSRYVAPTRERDLDAECALDALESEGFVVVPKSRLAAREEPLTSFCGPTTSEDAHLGGITPTADQPKRSDRAAMQLQVVVDFLDAWRFCPVSYSPRRQRQCLEDAAGQLLAALAAREEPGYDWKSKTTWRLRVCEICGRDAANLVLTPSCEHRMVEVVVAPAAAREEPRLTHGRHCPCSACAAEDWTRPELACCGMHGPTCPARYAPIRGIVPAREEPRGRRVPGMKPNLFGDPASRAASARQREAFERRHGVPGPPQPPLVPGHLGQPRDEVIKAARTVFGVLTMLEEMGMDVEQTRQSWVRQAENIGLRESDLLAAREGPQPDARVTVGQSRIGPASAAVNKRRKRCHAGDPTPSGPVNDVEAEAINRAYDAMLDETELPDDFDAARKMAMAAVLAARFHRARCGDAWPQGRAHDLCPRERHGR